jgi:hypothetical protein
VVDVHLIEMGEEGGFELRLRHRLDTGESALEEAQRVPTDPRRDVAPGGGSEQQQFPAERLRFLARHEPVLIEVESVEQLVRAIAGLIAGEVGLLQGNDRLGARLGGYDSAERGGDEHSHNKNRVPELNRRAFVPTAGTLSS